jgi:FkbM family methyltransferase
MNILKRIANLNERVAWMKEFTGSSLSALRFWLYASRNLDHVCVGAYQGTEIAFRGLDTMAIKEVLVDMEYANVVHRLVDLDAPVILDIGAHIGLFSLSVLKKKPRARVLSVEADPQTYSVLMRNIAALHANGANWEAINAAAWGEDGMQLCFEAAGPSMSHRVSDSGKVFVNTTTLKSLVNRVLERHDAIDMLKIDIEGSEESFLCAAPEMLRHVRSLVIELHPGLCNADRVRDVLASAYSTFVDLHDRTSSKPLLLCY